MNYAYNDNKMVTATKNNFLNTNIFLEMYYNQESQDQTISEQSKLQVN